MSTLIVDQIKNNAGRVFAPVHTWVNFDGTGVVSIRDSLNVSSITDNGTGDYTVNFATALGNVDYAAAVAATESAFGANVALGGPNCLVATVSSIRLVFYRSNTAFADTDRAHMHITGGIS